MSSKNIDFMERFENQIKETIKDYGLLKPDDKVLVASSGGKDSTIVLYLLKKFGYDVSGLIIDLHMGDWSETNLKNIQNFCKEHELELEVISTRDIFGSSMCHLKSIIKQNGKSLKSCTICGVIKRWLLNRKARKMGAIKLATGHNLDDEAQTVLMNLFGGNLNSFVRGPKVDIAKDKKFITRIKPLYFSLEKDIRRYSELMGFEVLYDRCPCSHGGLRSMVRNMLNALETENPEIKRNILSTYMHFLPSLMRKFRDSGPVIYCKHCGEPTRNEVCKVCKFMGNQ